MTIATNFMPNWLGYSVTAGTGTTFSRSIGLHQSCSSVNDPPCRSFPHEEDCLSEDRYFCSMWRTVGFLMAFACVVELATIVGFLVIMSGGKMMRERGWKILAWLLAVVAIVQFVSMAFVVSPAPQATWLSGLSIGDGLTGRLSAGLSHRQRRAVPCPGLAPGYVLDPLHGQRLRRRALRCRPRCLVLFTASRGRLRVP